MYSQDKIDVALKVFHQCGPVTTTIRVLGYPTRRALYTWIANEGSAKSERKPEYSGRYYTSIPVFFKHFFRKNAD